MKREELEAIGLTAEQIDAVMKANGSDINRERAKFADYDDVKKQLETANATLDKMKDYDEVKADVLKYQQEAEKAKADAAAKVQQYELQNKIKDFTSTKKFVNDLTRDAINAQLESALNDDANKGKSLDDLLKAITDGKTDIFKNENTPTPPTVAPMAAPAAQPAAPAAAGAAAAPKASWNKFKG
ncbi:MAG: phage scaffolding protein [Bacteroidaceae bacterium]|nr:phage scaffolding protein [Bacteroidaceae bacterium]